MTWIFCVESWNQNAKKYSHSQILPQDSAKLLSKSCKFSNLTNGCLVQIFTTRGIVAPPANNLIMSGTSIRSLTLTLKNWKFPQLWLQFCTILRQNLTIAILYFFCVMVLRFYTKKFKWFWAKMKVWHWFFRFKMKSKFGKNCCHAFIFSWIDLRNFV